MIALADVERFSIITIFDPDRPVPTWKRMFGWSGNDGGTVPLAVRSAADRKLWAARLDHAVRDAERQVLLVADGMGCQASAWWARLSPRDDVARVAGALLFAPDHAASDTAGLFASPPTHLPFPSLVIRPDGSQDVGATVDRWGSRIVTGHRTRAHGGVAAWHHAQRLFVRLTTQVAAHEVGRAEALAGRSSSHGK